MRGRELLLVPDWSRSETWLPALAAFTTLAEPTGPDRLVLDARDADLPPALLMELLGGACAWTTGSTDFAEVAVLADPADPAPGDAGRVRDADSVALALGRSAPAPPRDPVEMVHAAREAKDVIDGLDRMVAAHRYGAAADPWSDPEPLVSVRIPTWGGTDLLLRRALPSVLGGVYRNVEVVVVSDGPDPAARAALASVRDPRVRFVEVPVRPTYATAPQSFWQTAGTSAVNLGLDHCRGDFVAPLDHDDAFTDTHIVELLGALREAGADLVYGQAACELRDGGWTVIGSAPLRCGQITHGSVMYSRRLLHMRYDPLAWLHDEPGDWNMWRRMSEIGARICHLPRVVQVHFREKTAIEDDPATDEATLAGPVSVPDEDLARDLRHVGAEWLARIPRRTEVHA